MHRLFLFLLLVSVALGCALRAGAVAQEGAAPAAGAAAKQEGAPAKQDVRTFTLSPEKYEKAVAFSRAKYRLYFFEFVYGVVVLLGILTWRLAPRLRDWAERASARRFLQVIVFAPLLQGAIAVLNLPTDLYRQWLARHYDQSVQGWGSWAWDWTKGLLVALVVGTLIVWILYGVIRRSPRRWWFAFWLASLPIIVLLVFVAPVLIDPLFYEFEPLAQPQPELVAQLEKVVERGGLQIPRERMFQMKASAKLKAGNAYVSGVGASKRVVVWDTTLAQLTPAQTLSVFGHEMGHYVLWHIPRTLAFLAVLLLPLLYLGFRGMQGALARWGARWAIRGADDWASLPVLMLLFSVLLFFSAPVLNTYSRYQEHEADVYGLEVIHGIVPDSALAASQAFQILGEIALADPDPHPFIRFWLYSHPPLRERIEFARAYDPWARGEPRRFVP